MFLFQYFQTETGQEKNFSRCQLIDDSDWGIFNNDFKTKLPADWFYNQREESAYGINWQVMFGTKANRDLVRIGLVSQSLEQIKAVLERSLAGFEVVNERQVKVAGIAAQKITFIADQFDYRLAIYYLPYKKDGYLLLGPAEEDLSECQGEIFEKIVINFKLN